MKQVTIVVDDEELYRALEAEAARQGRSVQDAVAEALGDWLRNRRRISPADQLRRHEALKALDRLRATLPVSNTIEETLAEIRDERSRMPDDRD